MEACPHPEKIVYRSRKAARLSRRRQHKPSTNGHVRAYLCVCGGYHLGRVPPYVMQGRPPIPRTAKLQ